MRAGDLDLLILNVAISLGELLEPALILEPCWSLLYACLPLASCEWVAEDLDLLELPKVFVHLVGC